MTNAVRDKVFVSYSHDDEGPFNEFCEMRRMMIPEVEELVWHDKKIPPGKRWLAEIKNGLAAARAGVLLVSPNFVKSQFTRREVLALLGAAKKHGTEILWVLLESCDVPAKIREYQAVHESIRPLNTLRPEERIKTWVRLCEKLRGIVSCPPDQRLFLEFFGAGACHSDGFETVFLNAKLPPFCANQEHWEEEQERHREGDNILLEMPPPGSENTWPKGIDHIVPFEDLEAVLEIDREFRKYGAKLTLTRDRYRLPDKTKEQDSLLPARGCIAIGLGYNNVTCRLQAKKLYQIRYHAVTPGSPRGEDDGSEDVVIGNQIGPRRGFDDYALLARVLCAGKPESPVSHIVCAGHTTPATAHACRFLASSWKQLAELYARGNRSLNRESMAVFLRLRHQTREPVLGKPKFVEYVP